MKTALGSIAVLLFVAAIPTGKQMPFHNVTIKRKH